MKLFILVGEGGSILKVSDSTINHSLNLDNIEIEYDTGEDVDSFLKNLKTYKQTSEFKMKVLRGKRDLLLKESDTLFIEATTKDKKVQEVKEYKQLLRDLPNTVDIDTLNIEQLYTIFPTTPSLKE